MADASYQQYGGARNGATVSTAFTGAFVSPGEILAEDAYAPAEIAFPPKLSLPRNRGSAHVTAAAPSKCRLFGRRPGFCAVMAASGRLAGILASGPELPATRGDLPCPCTSKGDAKCASGEHVAGSTRGPVSAMGFKLKTKNTCQMRHLFSFGGNGICP